MRRSLFFVLLASGAVLLAGCSEKELGSDGQKQAETKDNVVSLSIGSAVTKSGVLQTEERSIIADLSEESGIEGLVLEESVVNLDNLQVETKGTPVYTENFDDLYASSGFNASAVYNSSNQAVAGLAPALFKKKDNSNHWIHDYTGTTLAASYLFYFNAPAILPAYIGTPGYAPATKSLSFNLVSDSYPTAATAQTDVLFTNATIDPSTVNSINFYHVFASVKFKLGNTDTRTQITKVELSNMLTSGKCTVTVGAENTGVVWEQPATSTYAKFSQEYDGTTDYAGEDGFFADSFYKDNTYKNNLNKNGDTKATTTFDCVPRTFAVADEMHVVATITYTIDGESKTAEVDFTNALALNGKSWEAGHLYTYTLTITDLDVTVTDSVNGDIKSDVVITNTGNTSGYIRAAIVANWVKELGDETVIVKGVGIEERTMIGFDKTSWIPGSDGYYYYKYGVDAGKATKTPLFESYKADPPTIDGATLQMTIHAQIVKDRSVWGDAVPGEVSKEVEE